MKVSEAVAHTLASEGAEVVFSLLGDTNMEMVVRLSQLGLPVHECRHEATAMAMADGYARANGGVAICAVTAGAAFAHTFTPLLSASRQPSRVIVLTGPHSRDDLEHRQALDHEGVTRLTGAYYRPLGSPGVAVERTRAVMDLVRADRKPVVLDVAEDVQAMEYPWDLDQRDRTAWLTSQRVHPDPAALSTGVALLQAAERPVLLAGAGAAAADTRDAIAALASDTGALLATTLNARGLFHGFEFNAGVAGLFSAPASAELFAEADVVVSFGASMNSKTTEGGYLFPAAKFVQIDITHPSSMDSGQSADCYIQGDALVVARELRAAIAGRQPAEGYRTTEVAKRLNADVDTAVFDVAPGEVDPRVLCAQLDELLPDDCDVMSGAAHYWSWPIMYMPRWRRPLYSSYAGAIGYSIAAAVGASLATKRPIVAFEGDGGFLMYPNVLDTAVRSGARVLALIFNDRALGSEFHKLRGKGLDNSLAESSNLDLAGIATQMGCRARTLTDVSELAGYVDEFLTGHGPMLIDARVSRNVISIPFRRTVFGIE